MRNNIDFFADNWNSVNVPRPFLPMAISVVGMFVFGIMAVPPSVWAPWSVLLFTFFTVVFVGMLVGVRTHYSRHLSNAEYETLCLYNKLSDENKKAIGLSAKDFEGMYDAYTVRSHIKTLLEVQTRRAEYAMKIDGRNSERIRRLTERVESEREAMKIDAEVAKELG